MNHTNEPCDDTAAEAFRWVLQFSGNRSLSDRMLTEFSDWLLLAPEHIRQYQLAATLYTCMNRLRPIADHEKAFWAARAERICRVLVDREAPISMSEVLWRPTALASEKSARRRAGFMRAISAAGVTAVAAAAAALAVGAMFLSDSSPAWVHYRADGSSRQVQLSDGSRLTLLPRSEVRMRLSPSNHVVELTRGAVALEFADDPARPFHVDAAEASMLASTSQLSVSGSDSPVAIRGDSGTMPVSTACQVGTSQTGMTAQMDSEGGIEISKVRECEVRSQLDLHRLITALSSARAVAQDYANSLQRTLAERDEAVDVMRTANLQLANAQSALQETRRQLLETASSSSAPWENEPRRIGGIDPSVAGFEFDKCANWYDANEGGEWPVAASRMWDSVTMQFVPFEEWAMMQRMRWSTWVREECEKLDRGNALQPGTALA